MVAGSRGTLRPMLRRRGNAVGLVLSFGTSLVVVSSFARVALANAVLPHAGLLRHDRVAPAAIALVAIIMIEAAVLWRALRPMAFVGALGRSALMNAMSGGAAWMLLSLEPFGPIGSDDWVPVSVVFFFLSVGLEIPLLRLLNSAKPNALSSAVSVALLTNIASAVSLVVGPWVLAIGWILIGHYFDERDARAWTHPDMPSEGLGALYADVRGRDGLHIARWDVRVSAWTELPACNTVRWDEWDIVGKMAVRLLAVGSGDQRKTIQVVTMPTCEVMAELGPTPSLVPGEGTSQVHGLSLSPDGAKLALRACTRELTVKRDKRTAWHLGKKCRVHVLDARTLSLTATVPRAASDDDRIGWTPDSAVVLFPSYHDEALYEVPDPGTDVSSFHGVGYSDDGPFAAGLYGFSLSDSGVRRFSPGSSPVPIPARNTVLTLHGDALDERTLQGDLVRSIPVDRLHRGPDGVSPNGRFVLVSIGLLSPLYGVRRQVIVDLDDPSRRHILNGTAGFQAVWTAAP